MTVFYRKAYFQNFSRIQFHVFKLNMIMCVSLLSWTTVSQSPVYEPFCDFKLKSSQPTCNSFGEVFSSRRATKYEKNSHFKKIKFETLLLDISDYAFAILVYSLKENCGISFFFFSSPLDRYKK